jgi:hypothetical protein
MCWYCGLPVTELEPFGRSLRCLTCGKDMRSCKNCRFFLPGARGDCREANTEGQADKERANFCDWFSFDQKYREQTGGQENDRKKAEDSKAAFDNLFK